jgi:hypothetical protein
VAGLVLVSLVTSWLEWARLLAALLRLVAGMVLVFRVVAWWLAALLRLVAGGVLVFRVAAWLEWVRPLASLRMLMVDLVSWVP